jgi:response regulator RpfG family c-di-GMP phosphodiesterase
MPDRKMPMSKLKEKVLFVDDDVNVLSSMNRRFRKTLDLSTAQSGPDALALLAKSGGDYAVVISDMKMPKMSGARLLEEIQKLYPDIIGIILTGHADVESAVIAVNQGRTFRFLTKPCKPEDIGQAIVDAIKQYRLVHAEQSLLKETLTGSVSMLTELVGISDPLLFYQSGKVKQITAFLLDQMNIEDKWEFEVAAMFANLGYISIPQPLLKKHFSSAVLEPSEQIIVDAAETFSAQLVKHIPRLENVASMLDDRNCGHNIGSQTPYHAIEDRIKFGGSLVRITTDFVTLLMQGVSIADAVATLAKKKDKYDSYLLKLITGYQDADESDGDVISLDAEQLVAGMILLQDVKTNQGVLLLKQNQQLTEAALLKLIMSARNKTLVQPILVSKGDLT